MVTEDDLRKSVFEEIDIAVFENGYDEILEWTAPQIAVDLISWSATFNNHKISEIVPHCEAWIRERWRDYASVCR